MHNSFSILEHHCIYATDSALPKMEDGNLALPNAVFAQLKQFVLENGDETCRFLIPSFRKGIGETLKAQQFVGVIETKGGISIEILPKIGSAEEPNAIRKTFLAMLRELRHSPFNHFDTAHLNTDRMHLLEIFITMFLEELTLLVKRGIKSDYLAREENTRVLKGRLKIGDHIRHNIVHKERFAVEFDEYDQNRIENRLIKTTLQFLYKKSSNSLNVKRIREFLFVFDDIDPVHDFKSAFAKVKMDRQMKEYERVIRWSRLFLNNESFSSFSGNSVAFALLFDMNKVFEDFVAHHLRKIGHSVETQLREKSLIEQPSPKFALRPDLRINGTIIADTKWKVIADSRDISQADLYQLFAYAKKFSMPRVVLIYPYHDRFPEIETMLYDENSSLSVMWFDCQTCLFSQEFEVLN